MKDKKRGIDEDKITGFFDENTEMKGDLNFKGSFRIDGRFKGKIDSDSTLVVGDSGKVDADIKVANIVISGEVKGNIIASERVEITSSGRVIGTIATPKLIVEEGAYLEASCQTTNGAISITPEKLNIKKDKADLGNES
ncbi:MAG: polymer-forming cytoskeletal protein [Candidatus Aminicenantes bacterium]|nr:polymer-forming cytoskeletal protein [Candidatus Aminicenantes bacterium]